MIDKNFSIENCQCLDNKNPFDFKYLIVTLKNKMIDNKNPTLQASDKIKKVDSAIKAKIELNEAIKDKLIFDAKPEYISPINIQLKDKNDKKKIINNINKKKKMSLLSENNVFLNEKQPIITNYKIIMNIYNLKKNQYFSFIILILMLFILYTKY